MKSLKRTGPGPDGHYHIAFLDEDNYVGALAMAEEHTHPVEWRPPVPEQPEQQPKIDPNTGQMIAPGMPAQPAQPGMWIVGPAEDGHTHEGFEAIEKVKPKKTKPNEKETVEEVILDWKIALEIEGPSRTDAELAEKVHCGEQWEPDEKNYLHGLDRAALTINQIERNIDQLSGYQREQRTDLRFTPTEDGDQSVADILNISSKVDFSRCYFETAESDVFEDSAITGRGWFNAYMDFSTDLRGVWTVERMPWCDVVAGEHEKRDLSDCDVIIKSKMYSRSKVKQLWPKQADKVDKIFMDLYEPTNGDHVTYADDQYDHEQVSTPVPLTIAGTSYVDTIRKEIRVLERWKRIYEPVWVIALPRSNFYEAAWYWKDEDIEAARTLPGAFVMEKKIQRIRITKICGNVLLSDENPADVPGDDFHVVPVYAKKRRGRFWGKVKPLIDPQMEVNKRHSQAIDIGNKMCAWGFYIDQSTFADPSEERKFRDEASSPGWVIKVASLDRRPAVQEGVKFPNEIVQLLQLENQALADLANIVATPAGANESGFAFMQRMKQRLTGNQYLFDNLSMAKKKIGRLYVRAVQKFYTPERILRMIRSKATGPDASIGGTPASQWSDDDILKLLEDADLSLYDVEITESSYSATARTATFILISELAKSGVQIPPEVMIKAADIPEAMKQEFLTSYQQQSQAAQEEKQATEEMEIGKTLAARGIFTPKVKQMLGMPADGGATAAPEQTDFQGDGGITAG